MQIREIILYGNNGKTRRIQLRLGTVNIITGDSKKGKSSLIDIIKYCLGVDSFSVAEGVIREAVAWYALVLDFGTHQTFVARKAPDVGFSVSNEIFLNSGKNIVTPKVTELKGTLNSASLREYLSGKLRIAENLHEVPEGQTRAPVAAEVKHALIFCIQEQGEIASKSTLFHRQSEPYLPQSIKDTLPFFLGLIPEDRLVKMGQLRELKGELREAQRELREAEMLRGDGLHRGWALLAEAEEVGLLGAGISRPKDTATLLRLLEPLKSYNPEAQAQAAPGDPFPALVSESQKLLGEFERVREEVRYAKKFEADQQGFSFEAKAQETRLKSIELYKLDGVEGNGKCPLCTNDLKDLLPSVTEFNEAIQGLTTQLDGVGQERPKLRSFIEEKERRITEIKSRLKAIQTAMTSIRNSDLKARELAELERKRERVAGRVSLYLEGVRVTDNLSDLQKELKRLQDSIAKLEKELGEFDFEEVRDSMSSVLGVRMSPMAAHLELEHSEKTLRLDLAKLTVVAYSESGPTPLSRIGSGANHLGYHLVSHIALHEWFVEKDRPVPRFLFLDQPTQVYYPPDQRDPRFKNLKSEDQVAVERMFRWLIERTEKMAGKFQLIVTDHADIEEKWFRDHVVETWRGDAALIPSDWLRG